MLRLFFLLCLFILGVSLWVLLAKIYTLQTQSKNTGIFPKEIKQQFSTIKQDNIFTSLFVPYWTLTDQMSQDFDAYIYFGITVSKNGLETAEVGYRNIDTFLNNIDSTKKKYLTLRMLNNEINFAVLESERLSKNIINSTVLLAKEKNFDGIILDLEISALPFNSLIQQISHFNQLFAQKVKKEGLYYGIALYGDVFYRIRPFDVKQIAKEVDAVYVMAYDFSKAKGSKPGPNFPLYGKEYFGYDYEMLIKHFKDSVPQDKLTVIFGLYGYDWLVDEKQNVLKQGQPITLNQAKERFLKRCSYKNCRVEREKMSSEMKVQYIDENNYHHVVWFEDMESIKRKQEFLINNHITNFSYWANSYF